MSQSTDSSPALRGMDADVATVLVGMHRVLSELEVKVRGDLENLRSQVEEQLDQTLGQTRTLSTQAASALAEARAAATTFKSAHAAWVDARSIVDASVQEKMGHLIARADEAALSLERRAAKALAAAEKQMQQERAATQAAREEIAQTLTNRVRTIERRLLSDAEKNAEERQAIAKMVADLVQRTQDFERRTLNIKRGMLAAAGVIAIVVLGIAIFLVSQ